MNICVVVLMVSRLSIVHSILFRNWRHLQSQFYTSMSCHSQQYNSSSFSLEPMNFYRLQYTLATRYILSRRFSGVFHLNVYQIQRTLRFESTILICNVIVLQHLISNLYNILKYIKENKYNIFYILLEE